MRGRWRAEQGLRAQGFGLIAGVDEAGRGPLAGPVVAAAVILPAGCRLPGLADSKSISAAQRERLCRLIRKRAVSFGIGLVDAATIDEVNILQATYQAMRQAIEELAPPAEALLVDGWELPDAPVPQMALVQGDRSCACIAAASILAKVFRDEMMRDLDTFFPAYRFRSNKGYGTLEHRRVLSVLGPTPLHRRTFAGVQPPLFREGN